MELLRGYAQSELGQLHFCEMGHGSPLILLHQTPRSMDEFADVLPLFAQQHRSIAMDMIGFGLSPSVPASHSIEIMSDGVLAFVNWLGIDEFSLLGHHTGGAVAIETAARLGNRVSRLVLSSTPFTGKEFREKHADGPGVDVAGSDSDGKHLIELWSLRAPFYPTDRPDILDRFIRDALAPGVDPQEGHLACSRYHMEDLIEKVLSPTLLIAAGLDNFALPEIPVLQAALKNAASVQVETISQGRIPLMEEFPNEVAAAVLPFLARVPAR